tara:strand:+ start:329 stop:1222 length:894 start_codon:yes stop_codon:yes gene_type:complete
MANNKLYGFQPEYSKSHEQVAALDRTNPYEFRKGMDYELTKLGCLRLHESTVEEREKATKTVLKNLEEHAAYYSAIIQFEGGMNQGSKITETNFKKFLESYMPGDPGTGLVPVGQDIKNDKMTALKEAITKEIQDLLKEDEDKEPTKGQIKKAGMSLSKTKDQLIKLKDQIQALKDKRKNMFKAYKEKIKDLDPDKSKAEFKKYADKQDPITKDIKDKESEIKDLESNLEEARVDEREMRREAAKTMMGKDVHLEILNIIKEHGISLREGAEGVRVYYEIAKLAYMEGITAGMKKNI